MDWVERYVEAVKRYLPRNTRDDIGAELHSVIEEKIIERKRAEGHEPTEGEVLQLLKEHGHPLKVASAYREDRVMISAPLVPIYKMALKWVFISLFAVWTIQTVLASGGVSSYASRLDIDYFGLGAVYFLVTTAVFVLCDRYFVQVDFFHRWKPEKLPAMQAYAAPIPLSESIVGIVFSQIWLVILTALRSDYSWALLTASAGDIPGTVLLWLKLHAICGIGLQLVNVFQPYWTPFKAAVDAILTLALAGVFAYLIFAVPQLSQLVLEAAEETPAQDDLEKLQKIDTILRAGLGIVVIGLLIPAGFSIYRAFDLRREK